MNDDALPPVSGETPDAVLAGLRLEVADLSLRVLSLEQRLSQGGADDYA